MGVTTTRRDYEVKGDQYFLRVYTTLRLAFLTSLVLISLVSYWPNWSLAHFGQNLTQNPTLGLITVTEVLSVLISKWYTANETVMRARVRSELVPQASRRNKLSLLSKGLKRARDHLEPFCQLWMAFTYFLVTNLVLLYIIICFGAPYNTLGTLQFSILMNLLTTLPVLLIFLDNKEAVLQVLRGPGAAFKTVDFKVSCLSKLGLGPLIGGWMGAFPIPLDWDREWQQWPIPCSIGALMGTFVSLCIVLVSNSELGNRLERDLRGLKKRS